jgi:hypothetical protein
MLEAQQGGALPTWTRQQFGRAPHVVLDPITLQQRQVTGGATTMLTKESEGSAVLFLQDQVSECPCVGPFGAPFAQYPGFGFTLPTAPRALVWMLREREGVDAWFERDADLLDRCILLGLSMVPPATVPSSRACGCWRSGMG